MVTKELSEIVERLDLLIKLMALNIMNDVTTQRDKIIQLASIGLKPIDIANILSVKSSYVRKELSLARKEGKL